MDIGQTKQLFLDDAIIAGMEGATRKLNQPTKHQGNPVVAMVRDDKRCWDAGLVMTFANVILDEGGKVFKMWYGVGGGDVGGSDASVALAYATSPDGITWHKPALGRAKFRGTTANNIVMNRDGCGTSVFRDPHETDPARRYKMLLRYEICAAYSPDGLRWAEYNQGQPVIGGAHDGHNLAYWDDLLGKYVAIVRDRTGPISEVRSQLVTDPEGRRGWKKLWDREGNRSPENHTLRRIGQAESDDFVNWTPTRCIVGADSDDPLNQDQFYNMEVMQYEGTRIGLMTVFSCDPAYSRAVVQLTCSRDGMNWERVGGREVFLAPGLLEDVDWGTIYPAQAPVVVGDEIWIYYVAHARDHLGNRPEGAPEPEHTSGMALARLRLDGFVSVDAEEQGALTTRPFTFRGGELVINADASDGQVMVEVQDVEGKPIPGFGRQDCLALRADEVRHTVTWTGKEDLKALEGKAVRLKFYLSRAKLFSLKFQN